MKQKPLVYALCAIIGIAIITLIYRGYIEKSTPPESVDGASPLMSFFITSANPGKGGDLGGLSGADAYCTTLAAKAGSTGKVWRAYLSTTSGKNLGQVDARNRIGDGPWYNYAGTLIASTLEELHTSNNITKATALTELGTVVSGRGDEVNVHDIMTGSTETGILAKGAADTTCSNWTSSDAGSAYVGHHDRIGINDSAAMKSWNASHASRGCSLDALKQSGGGGLFYCFAAE